MVNSYGSELDCVKMLRENDRMSQSLSSMSTSLPISSNIHDYRWLAIERGRIVQFIAITFITGGFLFLFSLLFPYYYLFWNFISQSIQIVSFCISFFSLYNCYEVLKQASKLSHLNEKDLLFNALIFVGYIQIIIFQIFASNYNIYVYMKFLAISIEIVPLSIFAVSYYSYQEYINMKRVCLAKKLDVFIISDIFTDLYKLLNPQTDLASHSIIVADQHELPPTDINDSIKILTNSFIKKHQEQVYKSLSIDKEESNQQTYNKNIDIFSRDTNSTQKELPV
ncbi:hypothetical protein WA158_005735 [Blastocystis sp. Blastoise]